MVQKTSGELSHFCRMEHPITLFYRVGIKYLYSEKQLKDIKILLTL